MRRIFNHSRNHTLTCENCGKQFRANTPRRKSCSNRCWRGRLKKMRRLVWTPERAKAHGLVHRELWRGTLVPQPCEVCGKRKKVVAHHDDYSKPLDVRWLCGSHHKQHHLKHGPGKFSHREPTP